MGVAGMILNSSYMLLFGRFPHSLRTFSTSEFMLPVNQLMLEHTQVCDVVYMALTLQYWDVPGTSQATN